MTLDLRLAEIAGLAGNDDFTEIDDADRIGELTGKVVILLDQQNAHAAFVSEK